jgi:hypothetical protein
MTKDLTCIYLIITCVDYLTMSTENEINNHLTLIGEVKTINRLNEYCYLLLFFFSVLGFKLRAVSLIGRCSTTWATTHFCSGYFSELESHIFARSARTTILLIYTSHHSWDDRTVPSHPAFSVEMWSHEIFAQASLKPHLPNPNLPNHYNYRL